MHFNVKKNIKTENWPKSNQEQTEFGISEYRGCRKIEK